MPLPEDELLELDEEELEEELLDEELELLDEELDEEDEELDDEELLDDDEELEEEPEPEGAEHSFTPPATRPPKVASLHTKLPVRTL